MKKNYVAPSLKVVNLNMQVLLCGSEISNMEKFPSDPSHSDYNTSSSNIWVSNTSSIWD